MVQFLSTMLLMVMLGVIMLGIRWGRIGAPAWLTERRSIVVADLTAAGIWTAVAVITRVKAAEAAVVAWSARPTLLARHNAAKAATAEYVGDDAPTVRIQIGGKRVLQAPKASTDHHRGHGRVAFSTWCQLANAAHFNAMNRHAALMSKLRAKRLDLVTTVVTSTSSSGYYPALEALSRPADPAYFSLAGVKF